MEWGVQAELLLGAASRCACNESSWRQMHTPCEQYAALHVSSKPASAPAVGATCDTCTIHVSVKHHPDLQLAPTAARPCIMQVQLAA
jgi:hypothetical protein